MNFFDDVKGEESAAPEKKSELQEIKEMLLEIKSLFGGKVQAPVVAENNNPNDGEESVAEAGEVPMEAGYKEGVDKAAEQDGYSKESPKKKAIIAMLKKKKQIAQEI